VENPPQLNSPTEKPEVKYLVLQLGVQIEEETGKVVAAYFRIRPGKAAETREYAKGRALADYDRKGNLLGIELLGPCEIQILDKISRGERAPVKNFLRNSIPREMALV
jgi:uncharacterized protein YuzE